MVLPFLLPCIFSILHYVLTLMAIAIPLVLAALSIWQRSRLYLALDTTILWPLGNWPHR
jgi:ABC-type iron transport system FetAB permease component